MLCFGFENWQLELVADARGLVAESPEELLIQVEEALEDGSITEDQIEAVIRGQRSFQ